MICGQCREREAVVFIRRSGAGAAGDSALCESCARSRGIAAGKGLLELSLDSLIAGADTGAQPAIARACPSCGLELAELKRTGRLGCPSCADAFRQELVRSVGSLGPSRAGARAEVPVGAASPPANARAGTSLERKLADALAAEDYEAAALIRDALSGSPGRLPERLDGSAFPLDPSSLIDAGAPESDVVLWTAARVCRDVEGFPFPGSMRRAASGAPALEGRFRSMDGCLVASMSELGPCVRRSLAERGLASREYSAVDGSLLASLPADRAYALLDSDDHLRSFGVRPGLDPGGALESALGVAERVGKDVEFASRPDIGWICASLADCGRAYSLSAAVHIPALAATGLQDRLFKALMSEGAAIRGLYSSSEGSAGSLYEVLIEADSPVADPVAALGAAAMAAASAERRARAELAQRGRDSLMDAEGRAFGIVRHCRLLGAEEGASLVSTLRLASLRGSLRGADPSSLAALLASLGPGSLGMAAGRRSPPAAEEQDSLRATVVKAALKDADYRPEEAS